MTEEIEKLLKSKNRDDFYLGLNLITEDSILFLNPEELYKILLLSKFKFDSNHIYRLKRVFSKVNFNFKIYDFI